MVCLTFRKQNKLVFVVLLFLSFFACAAPDVGDPYQLTTSSEGLVIQGVIAPDGKNLIYKFFTNNPPQYSLFSVSIDGGKSIKLNNPIAEFKLINDVIIFPDSSNVVFRVGSELYKTPIKGGNTQLLTFQHNVDEITISPDSKYLLFNTEGNSNKGLYSIRFSDGQKTLLTDSLGGEISISDYRVTSDSKSIVFLVEGSSQTRGLYVADIDGGSFIKLNISESDGGGRLLNFSLSGDNHFVVYEASIDSIDNRTRLFVSSLDGLMKKRIDPELTFLQTVDDYKIASDDNTILFVVTTQGTGSITQALWVAQYTDDLYFQVESERTFHRIFDYYFLSKLNAVLTVRYLDHEQAELVLFDIESEQTKVIYDDVAFFIQITADEEYAIYSRGTTQNDLYDLRSVNLSNGSDILLSNKVLRDGISILSSGRDAVFLSETFRHHGMLVSSLESGATYPLGSNCDATLIICTVPANVASFKLTDSESHVVYRSQYVMNDVLKSSGVLSAIRLKPIVDNSELCLPIKTKNGKIVMICL